MSNPTTNKPTVAVFNSSATLGSAVKATIPITEKGGLPRELVNNVLPFVWSGIGQMGTGLGPQWLNDYPATPNGADPTLNFNYSCQSLTYPNAAPNWASSTVRTLVVAIKHRHVASNPSGIAQFSIPLQVGGGQGGANGFGTTTDFNQNGILLSVANTGTITLGLQKSSGATYLTGTLGSTAVALTAGHQYLIAITIDDSGATKTRAARVYDHTGQALVTAAGGSINTATDTAAGVPSLSDVHLNAACVSGPGAITYLGEIYVAHCLTGAFADADFATLYADPNIFNRGTLSPSGALTAGPIRIGEVTNATISVTSGPATGLGTGGGTGAYAYQWYRSTDPTTLGTALAGQTSLVCTDATAVFGARYFYRLSVVDGTQTLYSAPLGTQPVAATLLKAPVLVLMLGDSEDEITVLGQQMARNINGRLRRVVVIDRGKAGSAIGSSTSAACWGNGLGPCIYTLSIAGGTPTSGVFKVQASLNGAGAVAGNNINWNDPAANVQAALEAASSIGAGNVLVSGGPLPGNPMTLTFRGAHATDTEVLALFTASNTMNNGAAPSFALAQQGYPAGGLLTPAMNEALTESLSGSATNFIVHMHIGENDAIANVTAAQFAAYYQQWIAQVRAGLPAAKIALLPPLFHFNNSLQPITDAQTLLLLQYQAVIPTLVDNQAVFWSGESPWDYFADDPKSMSADGLHWANQAMPQAGGYFERNIMAVIEPTTGRFLAGSFSGGMA